MEHLIIYNDNHWFSPIAISETIDQYKVEMGSPNVYSIGDNFDLANCRKEDIEIVKAYREKFAKYQNYADGNHEVTSKLNVIFPYQYKDKRIVLAHGDFEAWGYQRAIDFRSKPPGASWMKRLFIKPYNEVYDDLINSKIHQDFLDRAEISARPYAANFFICGHKHPQEIKTATTRNGVKVIVLPRGRNIIDLETL